MFEYHYALFYNSSVYFGASRSHRSLYYAKPNYFLRHNSLRGMNHQAMSPLNLAFSVS